MTALKSIYSSVSIFLSLFLLLAVGCQPKEKLDQPSIDGDKAIFSFRTVRSKAGEISTQLRGEWEDASLNTDARDRVTKLRIKGSSMKEDIVLTPSTTLQKEQLFQFLPSTLNGQICTFYFIANEDDDDLFASKTGVENFEIKSGNLFSKDMRPTNMMVSKYEVKRTGESWAYKRVFPDPMVDFVNATESKTQGDFTGAVIPILLYPLVSHIDISFKWPAADDPKYADFSKKKNGQLMKLKFKNFPKMMKLFQPTGDINPKYQVTETIDVVKELDNRDHWLEENKVYKYYFPGTGSKYEELSLNYTYNGVKISVKIDPTSKATYDLNTKYTLKVNYEIDYDVKFGRYYKGNETTTKDTTKKDRAKNIYFTNKFTGYEIRHKVGDWEVFEGNKMAVLHLGVPYRYSSIICTKSINAPAKLIDPKTIDPEVKWISNIKEDKQEAETVLEGTDVCYYQRWSIDYNVDHPAQRNSLVTELEFVNTKDESKKAKCIVSFNVLSRFAKMDVGEVNTFANGKEDAMDFDPDKDVFKRGLYYAWGRNIAFPDKNYEDPNSGIIIKNQSVNITTDDDMLNKNILYGYTYTSKDNKDFNRRVDWVQNANTWWITDSKKILTTKDFDDPQYAYAKTWKAFIGEQNRLYRLRHNKDMPKDYLGNNGGDPCPVDYRMPSFTELKVLQYNILGQRKYDMGYIPKKLNLKDNDGDQIKKHTEEGINPSGNPAVDSDRETQKFKASYWYKYPEIKKWITYSLRLISDDPNTPSQFATAYKYELIYGAYGTEQTHFKITCIPIKDIPTDDAGWRKLAKDVQTDDFWEATGEYTYNKYLKESQIFLYQRSKDEKREKGYYFCQYLIDKEAADIPEIWSSDALPYGNALDLDLSLTDSRTTDYHTHLNCIRCIRQ